MRLLALLNLSASVHLVVKRVVLLLLPAVRELAPVLVLAPVSVSLYEVLRFPLGALILLVVEGVRLPSEILPVVSIHASISGVVGIGIGAPHCLEMEDVEVGVLFELV